MVGLRPFLLVCILLACWPTLFASADESGSTPSQEDVTLDAYLAVWASGDVDQLDGLVQDDFRRHAGPQESPSSRADLKELVRQSHGLYRQLHFDVTDRFTTADGGAMRGVLRGGYKDSNKAVRIPVMALYRFEDGKLAEEWMLADNVSTLVALSYTFAPPGYEIVPKEPAAPASPAEASAPDGAGEEE